MLIYDIWFLFIYIFFVGNLIFVSKNKHLLVVLLRLEFIVLRIFFFLVLLMFIDYDIYILIVFLVFSVCEGSLGLSILVSIIRSHGNDYFQRFRIL